MQEKTPKVCTRCSLDSGKERLSCGGEYDPTKCMVKGYQPSRRMSEKYKAKLTAWADNNNIKFGEPEKTEAPTVKGEPANAMVAFDPGKVSWSIVNGEWVGSQK